jgi:ADP-heptose:LPS heptosyltransferase
VIDKMSQIGWVEQITIVGKTIGDKGCNDFKIGSIENIKKVKINDLRDKTSLNDLFYLVDKCGLLVTNDSGPMHISGAYNSDLIVLNSLKDPAYILPYHDSTTSFKCCEQKKLIADDFDISMFNPCRCDRPVLKDNILNYAPNIVEFC